MRVIDRRWPEHMREEIETIERETGVIFTAIADPVMSRAERKRFREELVEWFRWHKLDGFPRKLRKDGQPSQRGRRRS